MESAFNAHGETDETYNAVCGDPGQRCPPAEKRVSPASQPQRAALVLAAHHSDGGPSAAQSRFAATVTNHEEGMLSDLCLAGSTVDEVGSKIMFGAPGGRTTTEPGTTINSTPCRVGEAWVIYHNLVEFLKTS